METARLTSPHFLAGVALLFAALAVYVFARNPALRRRLRLTLGVALAALAAHVTLMTAPLPPGFGASIFGVEKLLLTLAFI